MGKIEGAAAGQQAEPSHFAAHREALPETNVYATPHREHEARFRDLRKDEGETAGQMDRKVEKWGRLTEAADVKANRFRQLADAATAGEGME